MTLAMVDPVVEVNRRLEGAGNSLPKPRERIRQDPILRAEQRIPLKYVA